MKVVLLSLALLLTMIESKSPPISVATLGADEIMIEDFTSPRFSWKAKNDPVMGGKSTGTVTVKGGVGKFVGQVVDVPFLHAPGFITMETKGGVYPDVSQCSAIKLVLKSNEAYGGYRFSFGNAHARGGRFAYGYKTPLVNVPLDKFDEMELPFSSFSDKWDDATGDIIIECKDDAKYCPTKKALQKLKTMQFWGEGVGGSVDLEIKSISAIGCASAELLGISLSNQEHSARSFGSFSYVMLVCAAAVIMFVVHRVKSHSTSKETYDEIRMEAS